MSVQIHPIPLGMDTCYLVRDRGVILVDGGVPGKVKVFLKALAALGIDPREVQLIVLTHGHFGHIGSIQAIQTLTGAQVAIHKLDKHGLETGAVALPPNFRGWGLRGRITAPLVKLVAPLTKITPARIDILLDNEGLSLEPYGIPGRILHTPGHTQGSVSVLLDTGDALVGCMAHSAKYFRWRPGLPIYAEDHDQIRASWRKLIDLGAKTIYPAHGKPFPVDLFLDELN